MKLFNPCVVYRRLCFVQGQHMHKSFIFWVALTSWITSAATQGLLTCGHVSLTGLGVILSPNYPSNYPNNINCTWRLLSSSDNTSIRLQFNRFTTESNLDSLRIYDEKGIMTSFSGSSLPPIVTLGRTALLVFTTDGSFSFLGFYLSFTSFDIKSHAQCTTNDVYWCNNSLQCISRTWRCDNQVDCSQGEDELGCPTTSLKASSYLSLTGSGIIVSPNYPSNYANNINCTWRLLSSSNATGIRLKFNSFDTEQKWDVLRIYDEKGIETLFSGSSLPPILTLGRTALLEFTTDSSVNKTGFNASFTSFDITYNAQCLTNDVYWCTNSRRCISRSWRCDNQLDCSQREDEMGCPTTTSAPPPCGSTVVGSGEIQSPNFPQYYPNNARCLWRLFSNSAGTNIRIQFNSFYLESNYDYVTVTDERYVSKRYTGSRSQFMLLLGSTATIEFYSDGSTNMQGFTAHFTSVNVTTRNQCMRSDTFWARPSRSALVFHGDVMDMQIARSEKMNIHVLQQQYLQRLLFIPSGTASNMENSGAICRPNASQRHTGATNIKIVHMVKTKPTAQ